MDRLEALRAFVRVIELGSFSQAASELRVKQSTVSKWIAALEDGLATRLIERTTRSQRATPAGRVLYDRAREILAAYESVKAEITAAEGAPAGRLRVSVPVVFGRRFLFAALPRFMRRYPDVELEVVADDRYLNLVAEGLDVAVRVGRPVDSTFRTQILGRSPRRLVASPRYLARRGAPARPRDLERHACLLHTGLKNDEVWSFRRDGRTVRVPVRGRFSANHSEALLLMAKSGQGIALLADWLVRREVEKGRLAVLLEDYTAPAAPIAAVLPPGPSVPLRVRAFLKFLADTVAREVSAESDQ
jgi:DNA-binding transcriptional LysR family regulator